MGVDAQLALGAVHDGENSVKECFDGGGIRAVSKKHFEYDFRLILGS